jgi:hypothetical protein
MNVPATIGIEWQTAGDPATMFRLKIDDRIVGENLTAAQAHLLVGEILERIVLPNKARKSQRQTIIEIAE